jgi:ParB-like chromosome segregation protein Spo0J
MHSFLKRAASIERFGFVNPVLTADDGEIVAGHGRIAAAKLLRVAPKYAFVNRLCPPRPY